MISQRDLISQILGLLVMDHGLFLATVWVTTLPSLIPTFIISLFLYILITLVILMILLPELHAQSKTINVAEQNELQG
jgi:hydrogenase-4 membrane subunit HyfE